VQIYLVRHGIAAERGPAWPDDTKRPLTSRGIDRLRRQVAGLATLDVTIDLVLTSPLVRARQTAETLAAGLPSRPPINVLPSLAPGSAYATFLDELSRAARGTGVACVGHEPEIGAFAGRLIGARRPLEFRKGAVCRIDVEAVPVSAPGRLRWFLTPRILRRAAP
jgi:phosphohistidine phosphatase